MYMSDEILNPREIRRRLGLNQQQFWGRIGVTQSGGSRYESGRTMPKPVRELLRVVHIEQIDLADLSREDMRVLEYLRKTKPELYETLKAAAREQAQPADKRILSGTAYAR
ncbi:transcriptional regulator [Chitiniphilus eburneus]|uniref:Transcriptional regulator n=2 Tax=Chitiniphilus eburneus TaxID=2571148 RepID=A0A4U0PCH3_9NEIS|nr:helix-turn-helix domain-containing protein [Chitiniphilus eburneus]TJZ65446.1 transcriptional regulator [Chitiniphilus eburneus]